MTEDRFKGIELRLDRLTDVVAEVARQGAAQAALLESHTLLSKRVDENAVSMNARMDELHSEIYGKDGIYNTIQKNQWVIGLMTFFGTLLATGTMSLLVFYLRGTL